MSYLIDASGYMKCVIGKGEGGRLRCNRMLWARRMRVMQLMRQDVAFSAARRHGLDQFFIHNIRTVTAAPTSARQMRRK